MNALMELMDLANGAGTGKHSTFGKLWSDSTVQWVYRPKDDPIRPDESDDFGKSIGPTSSTAL